MSDPITKFIGDYRFLSNFFEVNIVWPIAYLKRGATKPHFDGSRAFKTVEHAFQAAKTFEEMYQDQIREAFSPEEAKRIGQRVPLREDWEQVKEEIMLELLRQKFCPSIRPRLAWHLINTWPKDLMEGNRWGDDIWGVHHRTLKGQNKLGKLLMQVRDEIWDITQIISPREMGLPPRNRNVV